MYNILAQLMKLQNYKNFIVKIGPIQSALSSLSSIISATTGQKISLLGSFELSFQEKNFELSPDSVASKMRLGPKMATVPAKIKHW